METANKQKLNELKEKYGFREPDRGNLDDPNIVWRYSKPDYTQANLAFFQGKTQNHEAGSLEEVVENLVKKWEMEASHKADINQWETINHSKYEIQINGGDIADGKAVSEIGNYNGLLMNCPAYQKYNVSNDFEKSHDLFRGAFTDGFPWEVLKVFSGPPHVLFTWRHWASFSGEFQGRKGNNELIQMFGLCRATVNENLKIEKLEVFYDDNGFIDLMEKKKPKDVNEETIVGNVRCPFIKKQ